MSKHQFVSTLILLVVLNLIIKALFIFGIDLQVQQSVGQADYGLYFTLLNLCYIFQIINDFGLNLIHNTDTAEHGYIRKERWSRMLRLKIVFSLTYTLVVISVALALGYMYAWYLLGWLILNNILVSFISILRAGISGSARYKTEAMISVMDKALMILFCGFLLIRFSDFKIEWFVWAQTASLIITAVVAWLISSKFIFGIKEAAGKFDFKLILKETLPFTLTIFLMFIYTRSDSLMIEQLLPDGTHAVGVYAAGFRLLDAANMIAFLFSPLLIPMYVKLRHQREETIQLMQLAAGMMIFMTGMIAVGSYFWAGPIMELCYGTFDQEWVQTFRWLMISHIGIGMMYIFGSYLTAMREMRKQNILFAGIVILNLSLHFILIPALGIKGAAITTVITQLLAAAGLILLSHHVLHEKINSQLLLKAITYFFVIISSAWLLETSSLPWEFAIIIFCLVAFIAAFLFQLLRWQSFMDLLRKRQNAGNADFPG